MFSCKFAAYFQNTFSQEHLWTVASEPRYHKLLTDWKKSKKNYVFEAVIFLKAYCYCQSQETLFKHLIQMIYLREILHVQIQLF